MQIKRILSIINKLSMGPETVASIHMKLTSEGFKVSQRTVYRDLLNLEETFKMGNIRLHRHDGEFNKATWIITNAEGRSSMRNDLYLQTFLTEHLKPEWARYFTGNSIEDVFTNGNSISEAEAMIIQKNISQFSIQHSNWGEFIYDHEHYNRLKDIIWAISNQRIIHIVYYDHTKEVEQKVRPLKVVYHRGALNIMGWYIHEDSVTLQIQELDVIRMTKITNERYQQVNEDAIVRQALIDRFGIHDSTEKERQSVVLEMEEGPAIFLKNRNWHPTQVFRKVGERWRMEFSCILNIELIGWIFSWLEHVKVLDPPQLKEIVAARAQYIADMYRNNLPPVAPENTDNPFMIGK